MELRIISDLHLDVNSNFRLQLRNKEKFTIICGDVSGYYEKTSKWIRKNIKKGLFVAGNHIVYNESSHSIQHIIATYERNYPLTADISFLNNTFKIIDDIVFVGGTLWTDYRLYGDNQQDTYMWFATRNLNDFRWGKFNPRGFEKNEDKRLLKVLTPEHCLKMFYETIKAIDTACKMFPDKKIVVITHHAPSGISIPERYKNNETSPCYASNLEKFILKHPNIKLWCHGHIHSESDYMIGNCRVVCNPRGYIKYNENKLFDENFTIEV